MIMEEDSAETMRQPVQAEKLIKAEFDKVFLLSSLKNSSHCLGLRFVLKDQIDGAILQQAVDLTMQRYSYLNVRFIEKFRPYYAANPAPFRVLETRTLAEIGGPEVDYHLLAFTYYDATIRICFFHGLLDGGGILCIARTLVYYYIKLKYDANLSSEGIVTLSTPFNENEITDPFTLVGAKKVTSALPKMLKKRKKEKAFSFMDSRLVSPGQASKLYYINIPEEQMMMVCRRYEMSPAVMATLLLANSIRRLHPEAGLITAGLSMSIRRATDCQETLRNAVVPTTVYFPRNMIELPFEMQCTACRGQVIIATDEDFQLVAAKKMARVFNAFKKIPYTKLTNKIFSKMMSSFMSESFQVSYAGPNRMGAAEAYVNRMFIDYDAPAPGVFLEIAAVNHNMLLCFCQKWEEDVYVNAFMEELKNLGMNAEIIEKGHPQIPSWYSVFNK